MIINQTIFQSYYLHKVISYIKDKYGDELEFLWKKFPKNAIFRRKDSAKWYAALLVISEDKIGLIGKKDIEIIDLRMNLAEINKIIDNKEYFPGYHMNKKHWITIRLDGSVNIERIYSLIDISYSLARK